MNTGKTILVVGSIAIDTLETPLGNRTNLLGGSASYFSISAGLVAPVKIVGVVGEDYPEENRQVFLSREINIENVRVSKGKTFRWGAKYSHDYSTRDTIFTELGVFESFSPEINNCDCYSPLVFLGNIQPDIQLCVADMMISPEYLVSDTMNLWIDLYPKRLENVIKKSDIFLINHEEAAQFSGVSDIASAAKLFLDMGPSVVVIKMGAEGSYLAQNNSAIFIPVYPIKKLLDPTGAGDSFAGGFMGYLSKTSSPNFSEAVIAGSAMASFCVEGFGVEALLSATPERLKHRIKIIETLVSKRTII